MGFLNDRCLVGTNNGAYSPDSQGQWQRLGAYQFRITAIHRNGERLLAATGSGLWEIREHQWLQLHDETLTEVMDVVSHNGQLIAASAYGLALGKTAEAGRTNWHWLSDALPVNQRFTNALAALGDQILVGTEDGVLAYCPNNGWQQTSLQSIPVRCLLDTPHGLYAGSDAGIWYSQNNQEQYGTQWQVVSEPIPVYCLAAYGTLLLAGTEHGLHLLNDEHTWQPAGLQSTRISALAIDPADDRHWLAGGCPGGLWETENAGQSWTSIPAVRYEIEAISFPGEPA